MPEPVRLKSQGELGREAGRTQWLWPHWIPRCFVTLLVGQTGIGKSTVAQALAEAAYSAGVWPDGSTVPLVDGKAAKVRTLWLDTENRKLVLGQRCIDRHLTEEAIIVHDGTISDIRSAEVAAIMEASYKAYPDIGLIIVDSLRGAHPGDENKSEVATPIMNRLTEIAQDRKAALVGIHHLRKRNELVVRSQVEMDQIRGSSAFAQFAVSILALDQPVADDDLLRLSLIKSNLSEKQAPIGLRVDAARGIEVCELPGLRGRVTQLERAKEFLRWRLRNGPVHAGELDKEAYEKHGISRPTLHRAAEGMVDQTPEGWQLPGGGSHMRQEIFEINEIHETSETRDTQAQPSQASHVSGDAPAPTPKA